MAYFQYLELLFKVFIKSFCLQNILADILHELNIIDFNKPFYDLSDDFFCSYGLQLWLKIFSDALHLKFLKAALDFLLLLHRFLNFTHTFYAIEYQRVTEFKPFSFKGF